MAPPLRNPRKSSSHRRCSSEHLRPPPAFPRRFTRVGHPAYLGAVEEAFGADIDYSTVSHRRLPRLPAATARQSASAPARIRSLAHDRVALNAALAGSPHASRGSRWCRRGKLSVHRWLSPLAFLGEAPAAPSIRRSTVRCRLVDVQSSTSAPADHPRRHSRTRPRPRR